MKLRFFHCLALLSAVIIPAHSGQCLEKSLYINFDPVEIHQGALQMPGAETIADAGTPLLPVRSLRVVLPPATRLADISIELKMLGSYRQILDVAPAAGQLPIGIPAAHHAVIPKPAIYDHDALYPSDSYRISSLSISHGYPILILQVFPVRWNPVRHEALISQAGKLKIHIRDDEKQARTMSPTYRGLSSDRDAVAALVDNPLDVGLYPSPKAAGAADWEYLIVTSNSMVSTFQTLADHRASVDGMSTHIETMTDILAGYSGQDSAEKLRNFVIDAYSNHQTRYLVLGGDADIVPERGCYGRAEVSYTDNSIPTDYYFGALDGDWNADGDSIWGEPEDDVDLFAEVSVGRIPAGNATEAQKQIDKIIAYESWDAAPMSSLMLGEQADAVSWGGNMLDYLRQQMAGTPIQTLYDRDGVWSSSTLVNNYLNSDILNTINHMGHANESTVMKLYPSDVTGLTNTNPFFIYSQGCDAGAFDDSDCMAEYFTTKATGGAHAVIMNSRYGWYTPNSVFGSSNLFQREFLQAIYEEHITRLGDANTLSKERLAGLAEVYGSMRWCFFDITLFGDPATPIHWQCTASALHITPESPSEAGFHIMQDDAWVLQAAVHSDCAGEVPATPPATIQASFDNGDASIDLHDDGVSPDETAGDGHYSGLYSPHFLGPVEISFHASATGLSDGSAVLSGEIVPWMSYIQQASSSPWIDTSGGETLGSGTLLGTDDDGGWIVSIGFPFSFYGVAYSDIMVGTNGLIQVEHGSSYSSTEESFPLPYAGDNNGIIAPWWCDLNPGSTGTLRVLRDGISPHRHLTVEWNQVPHFDHVGMITFQASLYEGTNEIVFRYQDTSFGNMDYDHGADATVGIEGPNGIHGLQAYYHEAALADGSAILFSPISSTGQLFFDRPLYACSSQPQIQLMDADLNGQPSISVVVSSDTETDPLAVQLSPSTDPRIFSGLFTTAEGPPQTDSLLQVSDGNTLTLVYSDANPSGDRTAHALIDCRAPSLSDLNVSDVGARSATLNWSSDEYADSTAIAQPGGVTTSDPSFVQIHSLLLEGLQQCMSYTATVSSNDIAGNTGTAGPSASFTTLASTLAVDDDVEQGNSGWTIESPTDPGTGTNWSMVVDASASSPTHSWFSSDEDGEKEDLLIGGPWTLGSGQSSLSFQQHFDFESDWDGGVLEISTDGTTWSDITEASASFIEGAYTGAISSYAGTPLQGRDAFTGSSALMQSVVDLSSYSGSQIWIRFRLACDASVGGGGWWVDDILLESTSSCSSAEVIFSDGFDSGSSSNWSWTTN